MKVIAPAKINLYLWVGERRADGMHEIESVMQSVSLTDELTISASDGVTLDVSPPGSAPEDESNLVVAAVRALAGTCSTASGAEYAAIERAELGRPEVAIVPLINTLHYAGGLLGRPGSGPTITTGSRSQGSMAASSSSFAPQRRPETADRSLDAGSENR